MKAEQFVYIQYIVASYVPIHIFRVSIAIESFETAQRSGETASILVAICCLEVRGRESPEILHRDTLQQQYNLRSLSKIDHTE